ncbi:MAG: cyclic nucleotide-binding domain-containing protein [Bryobacteraceae bacterium]|jgi:CRP-like cAMP-binding protein
MLLSAADLFRGLAPATLEAVAAVAAEERREAGTFLFQAGDAAADFFVLCEGRLRLSVHSSGGIAHTVNRPGETLGWSSMAGFDAYSASAECIEPSTLLRIPAAKLTGILESDPVSGLEFFRRLARYIGGRLIESYGATLSMHPEKGAFGG